MNIKALLLVAIATGHFQVYAGKTELASAGIGIVYGIACEQVATRSPTKWVSVPSVIALLALQLGTWAYAHRHIGTPAEREERRNKLESVLLNIALSYAMTTVSAFGTLWIEEEIDPSKRTESSAVLPMRS